MGCGVWGMGCGVWGVGCGVWGVGCGVWGMGYGVWGMGYGVWGVGYGGERDGPQMEASNLEGFLTRGGGGMNKGVVWVFALGLASGVAYGQGPRPVAGVRMVVRVPGNVAPETAEIRYFLIGEFGGYGSFMRMTADAWSYEIPTVVDGKQAAEVKVVAYMPGCEFEVLDWKVEQAGTEKALTCRPVVMTRLRGRISPAEMTRGTVVQVYYMANWANRFMGIFDGPVMTVPLGTAELDATGAFEMSVPAFKGKDGNGDGQLEFYLNDGKDEKQAAELTVTGGGGANFLSAKSEYAEEVELVAERLKE